MRAHRQIQFSRVPLNGTRFASNPFECGACIRHSLFMRCIRVDGPSAGTLNTPSCIRIGDERVDMGHVRPASAIQLYSVNEQIFNLIRI